MKWFVLIILSYLLGSLPFGFMIGKSKGIDLRKVGSGNIGATNAGRMLGTKYGYICFILDGLKGLVPMLAARFFIDMDNLSAGSLFLWIMVGCSAIVGHIFSIYLNFKGGKGVSTSMGMVLGLYPFYTFPGLMTFAIWGVTLLIWKYVSLSSILAAVAFPVALVGWIIFDRGWRFGTLWPLVVVSFVIAMLIVFRHAENIKRLLEGSETKIMQKKPRAKVS